MKLDKETISILSSFASLNPGLVFKTGNVLMTRHQSNPTPIAKVEFANTQFPQDFALYDIARFLSVLSLFNDPKLEFDQTTVTIKDDDRRSAVLRFASPQIIVHPDYDKTIKAQMDIKFELDEKNFKHISKAIGAFSAPEIALVGDSERISLSTYNSQNSSVDRFSIDVGETDKEFKIIVNTPQIIGFPNRSYTVAASFKGLLEFRSENEHNTLQYWITASEKSKISN